MFNFLKKKLAEGIEKIKAAVKTEPKPEEKAEAIEQAKEEAEIVAEIEHKEQVAAAAGFESPEVEKAIHEPYEAIEEKPIEHPPVEKVAAPEKVPSVAEIKKKEKPRLLDRIKKAVTERTITEEEVREPLWDLQLGLIENDAAVEVAEKITGDLRTALVGRTIKRSDEIETIIKNTLHKSILDILSVDHVNLLEQAKKKKPFVIVFLGFNGSGKTTTVARIGYMLKNAGLSVVFAAADTWRAAAIEQLGEHAERLGVPIIKQKYGADPAAIIFDAVKYAQSHNIDVVLADTAGRSHANTNLMDEMKKIVRVNKPDLKILVIDALTGNDVYEQCRTFNEVAGVDGIILTKADVYDKGGAALSAAWTIKKPLLFLGVGQDYKDLQPFDAEKMVHNLLS